MSAFLFYKPDSNPARFSRRERFSQRLPVSSTSDNLSDGKAGASSNMPATSVGSSTMSLDNDFDIELSKLTPSYMANPLTQGMRDRRQDSSTTSQDEDRDSSHSLFPESSTSCGSGAMGLADQNAWHQEAIAEFSRPNDTPGYVNPEEVIATDQGAFPMAQDGHHTPGPPHSNQQEPHESESHSVAVQPCRQTSRSTPSPACYKAVSPDPAPSSLGASPRSPTFNNHIQTTANDSNVEDHGASAGEADPRSDVDMQSISSHDSERQVNMSNLQADYHLEGRIAGSSDNIMYSQDSAEYPGRISNWEIGIERLRSEAESLPSRRGSVSTRSQSCDSVRPEDITTLIERRTDADSRHLVPRSAITHETDNGPQPSVLPKSNPSQPDVDVEMENARQSCSNTTDFRDRESEATTSREYITEEARSGQCVTDDETDSDVSIPSTVRNSPAPRGQPTWLSSSSSPIQPRQMKFSHVEIRNVQHPKPRDKLAELSKKKTSDQLHCTPHANGPWQLDGTTLSVDIREVERIPVLIGYSTYRVVDGQLVQSITLVQGNTGLPFTRKPTSEEKNWHSRGMDTARKSRSRGPLSLEQKRDLVRLRDEGYSWNVIASKFPGRKKGSLQGIYYTKLRDTPNRISQTNQHRRCRPSNPPYTTHPPPRTSGVSMNSRAQPAKARNHSRYSFRPKPVV